MRALVALGIVVLFAVGVWLVFAQGDRNGAPRGVLSAGGDGAGRAGVASAADGGGAPAPTSVGQASPFSGDVDAPAGLRVLVLEPDLITPATGRVVQLYAFTPRRMGPPRYLRSLRSGRDGIAEGGDLAAGSYIVCAPGAAPGAPAPWTARTTLDEPNTDRLLRVVDRSSAAAIRIVANATFTPRYGVAPKLVLYRDDDGTGSPIEQSDLLKPGSRTLDLTAMSGRYHVDVVPIGELTVHPDNRVLDATAAGAREFVVAVVDNLARIDVSLTGLPGSELPARVYPQPAGVVLDDWPERLWWGPHRWHRADLQVPAIQGPRRVLVYGQNGIYRSRAIVDLAGDRAEVVVEPAVRVIVDQFVWDPARDVGAVLTAEVGDEVVARTVAPRFGADFPELGRPALGGELVVARGAAIKLELQRADGSVVWKREITPDAETVRVQIE